MEVLVNQFLGGMILYFSSIFCVLNTVYLEQQKIELAHNFNISYLANIVYKSITQKYFEDNVWIASLLELAMTLF
jgi:hypothetical protein